VTHYRVLVVEDDKSQRELMRRSVAEHVDEVAEAGSVEEAVALKGPFDVILCDYGLPDGTARDVAARVRADHFVVISGGEPPTDWDVQWIRKPVSLAELAAAVSSILWRRADP